MDKYVQEHHEAQIAERRRFAEMFRRSGKPSLAIKHNEAADRMTEKLAMMLVKDR